MRFFRGSRTDSDYRKVLHAKTLTGSQSTLYSKVSWKGRCVMTSPTIAMLRINHVTPGSGSVNVSLVKESIQKLEQQAQLRLRCVHA